MSASSTLRKSPESPSPEEKPKPPTAGATRGRDFDAAIIGGPTGSSALDWALRKGAEAQARMDALAAAGKQFVPVYRQRHDPAEERQRLLDAAMSGDWHGMTLDRFNAYTQELRLAASQVAEYIEAPRGILYLTGGIGTGKTHLAAGTAIRLVERGYPVRVYRAADVATMLRRAVGEKNIETVMNRLKNVRVLVIDDFGTEHMTDFLAAEWFDLLDYRYRQLAATIITSNVHPDSLDMPRLASRFQDEKGGATLITITARDFRALPKRPTLGVAASDYAPASTVAPRCQTCGGRGIVKRDLPVAHRHFGRAFPCPACRSGDEPLKNGGER